MSRPIFTSNRRQLIRLMGRDIHYCECGEEIFAEMETCWKCDRTTARSATSELRSTAWLGGSRDHKAEPKDMAGDYLLSLTLQLYARACDPQCSRELHERAFQLVEELKRRLARSQPPSARISRQHQPTE